MKRLLTILLLLVAGIVSAQETPPALLKSVNSQFYIRLADSSMWQNKGTPYGWHRVAKYSELEDELSGLQDSLDNKANRTFDNVASGAIANVKLANSTIGFAYNTSSLSPQWSGTTSLGNTATLSIPMASTASVTAGLLSKSDYDLFNAKQTALSGTGLLSFSGSTPSYNTTSSSIRSIISDETGTGSMVFGTSPTIGGTANFTNVEVSGAHTITSANAAADALRYNNTIASTNAYNSNAEAGTAFQFKFNAAGSLAVGGGISVVKENTTDGDFASEVGLYNRANGGNVTKVFKVSSAGIPRFPLLTGASTEMVTISTDGTIGRTAIPTGGGGGSVATIGIASANGLAGTSDGNATNPTLTLSTSVSGVVKANGTAFSAAIGDTDFQVPLTFSTGLTRTVNTITVNQAFTPTWTGVHTFSNNILANGQINMSGQSAARIIGGSTDWALNNAANNASNIAVLDNGNTTIRGSVAPLGGITFASLAAGRIIGGSTDFAINNNANTQNNLVVLDNGNVTARGTISASNFSGSSSNTNTGDQSTITGNAGTATALQTARTIGTLTGDVTSAGSSFDGTGNNTNATTLATVNANVGSFGSSTSIPTFTVNGKGLITAASGNAVIAPAGTLTGTTLAANVTASSLTGAAGGSFGTNAYTSTAYAPLASPALTGSPTTPTQMAGDNSTKIASTAYADAAAAVASNINTFSLSGDGTTTSFNTGIVAETSITPANLIIATPIDMPSSIAYTMSKVSMGGGTFNWYVVFATPPASGISNITFTYQLD